MANVNKKEYRKLQEANYTRTEIDAFYKACYKAYLRIIASKPTAIIAPLRGSEPLIKAVRLFASLEKKSHLIPPVYYPRIGQINYGESGRVINKIDQKFAPSLNPNEQERELSRMIDKIIKTKTKQGRINLTIIDEVRWGGSVSQAIDSIENIIAKKRNIAKIGINAITIAEKGFIQGKEYQNLKHRIPIREFVVPRVFTMDSNKFLFPLIEQKQLSFKWPIGIRYPKLGITKRAIKGRSDLFADLQAIWLNGGKKQGRLGQANKQLRLRRLPK